jgi:hypothetical protein
MLTDDDVARFRADGYLLPGRQLFGPEKLDALEEIFNEHLADKGSKLSDELDTPHFRDPRLLDFLLSDEVLDTSSCWSGRTSPCGPATSSRRTPRTGRATQWHEDTPRRTKNTRACALTGNGDDPLGHPPRTKNTRACALYETRSS